MKEVEKIFENLTDNDEESKTVQKNWKKPELKILSIPSKTQSGVVIGPVENVSYILVS